MINSNKANGHLTLNEAAAQWWANRFGLTEKRMEFKMALLKLLPTHDDWMTYNEYDPEGILLDATRTVTPCLGFLFSGDGLFPRKTGLQRRGNVLLAKEGYGSEWKLVDEVPNL